MLTKNPVSDEAIIQAVRTAGEQEKNDWATLEAISKLSGIPETLLREHLNELVREGILESSREWRAVVRFVMPDPKNSHFSCGFVPLFRIL